MLNLTDIKKRRKYNREFKQMVVELANARNTQEEMNLVHNYLIPAIKSGKAIPTDGASYAELKK
jgi:hypothetical protein